MECSSDKVNTMVASLQSRRKALEAKIVEKNRELKRLCIQEAELTGSLPPEIPLYPGETPPTFRRRVGTSFTYPENLINKLKFKEDESVASLELEYKIQKGIAEAALGLANDETANKSVRRKHRLMYQQSQQHLVELETRINLSSNQKLKKKARPESCYTTDFLNIPGNVTVNDTTVVFNEPKVQSLNQKILPHKTNLKQSQSYNNFSTQRNLHDPRFGHQMHKEQISNSNLQLPKSTISLDKDHVSYSKENMFMNNLNSTNMPSSHDMTSKVIDQDLTSKYRERFGSLDRRHTRNSSPRNHNNIDHETSAMSVQRYINSQPPQYPSTTVLLPNQMYPENSLLRTHSLDKVSLVSDNRKNSEKQWIETSLDSCDEPDEIPTYDLPPSRIKLHTPPIIQSENNLHTFEPLVNHFDTVPFESPKNHTVVQVGKWKPYREITKPFEMSDFYKYSTRFRNTPIINHNNNTTSELVQNITNTSTSQQTLQNKGLYQPLKPNNCQPLAQNISSMEETVCPVDSFETNNDLCLDESVFANEMLSWYQDETTPQSKTATLV